jgi:hypothetical protein
MAFFLAAAIIIFFLPRMTKQTFPAIAAICKNAGKGFVFLPASFESAANARRAGEGSKGPMLSAESALQIRYIKLYCLSSS